MEQKLQLIVLMLLVHIAVTSQQRVQQVSVLQGHTVQLSCPIADAHRTTVEWRNPEEKIMFFRRQKGEEPNFNHNDKMIQDKRYAIIKLSQSEFTISISNVAFKDGGRYTCTHYGSVTTERKVELTVIGRPRMSVTKHDGKPVIKCTAEANRFAPEITWRIDNGPEFQAHVHVHPENKKFVSSDMITVNPLGKRVTVKCLVRHPDLHSQPLMNFVKVGQNQKSHPTTTTISPTNQPQAPPTMSQSTTMTTGVSPTPSQSSERSSTGTAPPVFTWSSVSSTDSHLSTTADSVASVSSVANRRSEEDTDTDSHATSTTGWISASQTTEEITSFNGTDGNTTGRSDDPKMQAGSKGSSSVLVFLVAVLITCLLVVVIFFGIKLRRAHLAWKRENEDSDPSEESSKSKSSQDEKSTQGQRRRGLFNTAFTRYVVEEPTVITSVVNTAAMETAESVNKEQTPKPQTLRQTSAKQDIKETEL